MDLSLLIRKNILNLTPYSSARDEFDHVAEVYLDANENPFENGYNRYPDPYQKAVKNRLSEIKGLPVENMLLGNGSDEVLDLIYRAFCEPMQDNVVSHNPSYGMYPVLSEINNVPLRKVNLDEGFQLNAQAMIDASDKNTKLFFICSPNNPSGNILAKAEIKKILNLKRGLVIIDEAYIDFANTDSWLTELANYPNLIVCQTLSKAWGLAGLRVGMCFASAEIIKVLNAIKPPYNVNELSQQAALKALNEEKHFKSNLKIILNEKIKVEQALDQMPSILKRFASDANFILVRVADAKALYDYLMARQIIVRNRSKEYLCDNCLRLTIGTPEENERLIEGIKAYSKN
ncbi:histidinol-phosphate transaminase [Reichenbachiella carrageenanivorans]|uniref:Histidinol-phosphate aminotransferase n=1 Tax=Reichenbachiella carrageenanivorans TaxID=2979869 RepID=A0ABY6D414_9BACT|nr:histidinol-phosphate transaminase [Reichenbachiella carrageenanivorans]UXX80539.1 histidinol-phosphate transaminase [Reichenbachiella carrageenanivorans]